MKTMFESTECSRCGGTGQFSYCQLHGTMCFKCRGTGRQFTKRGAAARKYYNESLNRQVADIKVGDWVNDVLCRKWYQVNAIKPDSLNPNYVYLSTKHCDYGLPLDSVIASVRDNDELNQRKADAKAYQDSLTKAGKPRKRKQS